MIRVLDNDGKEILLAEDNGSMIHSAGTFIQKFWEHVWKNGLIGVFPGRVVRETRPGTKDFLLSLGRLLSIYELRLEVKMRSD